MEPLKIQISSQLMELLAIRLSCQKTTAKSLVMLRCGKNFLLTYHFICGAAKFFPRLAFGRTLNL